VAKETSGMVSGTTIRACVLHRFGEKKNKKIDLKNASKNESKYFTL